MGLTVYYELAAKADADKARKLVKQMRDFACRLPFDSVSEIFEYDPPDGQFAFKKGGRKDARGEQWKPGGLYLERKTDAGSTEAVHVPPLHSISFGANIRGSETALFGLASHPAVVVHHEDVVTQLELGGEERRVGAGPAVEFPTRLRGWYSWHSFCKTQYAANPRYGGVENFLRAHLSIYKMLDECKRLGLRMKVRDDGKYNRNRNQGTLLKELAKMDELVAGVVGSLGDALLNHGAADEGAFVAPIKDRPDYEHLEARGQEQLRRIGRRKRQKREGREKGDSRS
jgi:hypothetical protein